MQFRRYQHLERLGTTAVEGIQDGEVYVFPKLDGTNASVWLDDEGELQAGSRNRVLSSDNDNAGFLNEFVSKDYNNRLKALFSLRPEWTLFGEWLVPHSLKTYRPEAWRKFYIFDVMDEFDEYLHYREYSDTLKYLDLEYLSPIQIIKNGSDEHFRNCVERNTYLIEEGKGFGEGVVLKNYGWKNKFGQTIWAKIVANHFKETHYKEMGAPVLGGISDEERIVNEFVTSHLVDKVHAKIVNEVNEWNSGMIPRLLNTVFYDLITEEMWEILKRYKNPKIDFKYLQRLTIQKVKELKQDVFQ